MSTQRKPSILVICSKEELPAPGYTTLGASGNSSCSKFAVEYEFRPDLENSDKAAVLSNLAWSNGSGSPVLKLTGQAGPNMLKDLAAELILIAERMEDQLNIVRQLQTPS
jgi:hypothetical protein